MIYWGTKSATWHKPASWHRISHLCISAIVNNVRPSLVAKDEVEKKLSTNGALEKRAIKEDLRQPNSCKPNLYLNLTYLVLNQRLLEMGPVDGEHK